jgi:hypothetical protein
MDIEKLGCTDYGDVCELAVGSIVTVTFFVGTVLGALDPPSWLFQLVVVSAVAAIFGDKIYKYKKRIKGGK